MLNSLNHIGLQINDKDLKSFYFNILECKVEKEFILNKEEALQIFGLSEEVKIVYTKTGNIELELFVFNKNIQKNFNHICFTSNNSSIIAKKAKKENYRVFIRTKTDKSKTYFISDSSNNIFELKCKEII